MLTWRASRARPAFAREQGHAVGLGVLANNVAFIRSSRGLLGPRPWRPRCAHDAASAATPSPRRIEARRSRPRVHGPHASTWRTARQRRRDGGGLPSTPSTLRTSVAAAGTPRVTTRVLRRLFFDEEAPALFCFSEGGGVMRASRARRPSSAIGPWLEPPTVQRADRARLQQWFLEIHRSFTPQDAPGQSPSR